MENKEIDITNKVILDVETYIELMNKINTLEIQVKIKTEKYENILKYLFSECDVKTYAGGKKYLDYDSYNNHLSEYLKNIEPDMYEKELHREEVIEDE